jgi:DNA (cytosine-5)-methyltransferase 1
MHCVSVVSGAGGLDIGLEAAGFTIRACADIDPVSCRTLEVNRAIGLEGKHTFLRNATIFNVDLAKVSSAHLLAGSGLKRADVDLLAGGPPCQAFSVFGRRKGARDPRGRLVFRFYELVRELTPKVFILENVPGLATIDGGTLLDKLLEKLSQPRHRVSYKVSTFDLEAADFGVPQFRRRLFIVGNRLGLEVNPPEQTHWAPDESDGRSPWVTVATALAGLPFPEAGDLPNHRTRKHSLRMIARFRALKWGERDNPTRTNKLNPKTPAFTIVVGSDKGGGKGHIHPYELREITPREAARLQTFPDYWVFEGTIRDVIRQIGNALPPLFAAKVGVRILEDVYDISAPSHCQLLDRLAQTHLLRGSDESKMLTATV